MSVANPADIPHGNNDSPPPIEWTYKPGDRVKENRSRRSQWFKQQEISPGLVIDVITYPQQAEHYMAYMPKTNNIYIFGKSYDEMDRGHESNVDLAGLHESDHAQYFRLSALKQHALNDVIMKLVKSNPEAAAAFKQFVQAMYRRPGGDYLQSHQFGNPEVVEIISNHDTVAGLKDRRYLDIDVDGNGRVERLYLGLVLTEFFAYMSATHHPDLLDPETLDSIQAREVVEIAKTFRERFIDPNEWVRAGLEANGGHGLRRPIPDFKKFIRD